MAGGSPKGGKKGRKVGRNRDKCATYRLRGTREKNKARRAAQRERWLEKRQAKNRPKRGR